MDGIPSTIDQMVAVGLVSRQALEPYRAALRWRRDFAKAER